MLKGKQMKLHELKKGDKFTAEGNETIYTFHGMDGTYAKVSWEGIHDEYMMIGNPMMEVEKKDESN